MGVMGFKGKRTGTGHARRPRARHNMPERLESRTLFTAAAAAALNVEWKGHAVDAYAGQWVVQTTSDTDFDRLATQQGFTAVQSLGAGYYQFTSTDTVAQVKRLAADHPIALGSVQPNMVVSAASTLPDDPGLPAQWGLDNTGQLESYDYNDDGVVSPYDEQTFPNGPGVPTQFPTTSFPTRTRPASPAMTSTPSRRGTSPPGPRASSWPCWTPAST